MTTLTAKFHSVCSLCGDTISPGESIEYRTGTPARHTSCTPASVPADAIHLSIGQGYAPQFGGWTPGQVIVNHGRTHGSSAQRAQRNGTILPAWAAWCRDHPEPGLACRPQIAGGMRETYMERYQIHRQSYAAWEQEYAEARAVWEKESEAAKAALTGTEDDGPAFLYVLTASRRYYREDGMAFGVGDESGYVYRATCRPATEEEAAPVRAQRESAQRRSQAAAALNAVFTTIVQDGAYPEGQHQPEGERVPVGPGQDLYGGGQWFVIGDAWIWAITNNGADGDNWAHNNVRTGGAGAIGRRVTSTPELAARIRGLAQEVSGG